MNLVSDGSLYLRFAGKKVFRVVKTSENYVVAEYVVFVHILVGRLYWFVVDSDVRQIFTIHVNCVHKISQVAAKVYAIRLNLNS